MIKCSSDVLLDAAVAVASGDARSVETVDSDKRSDNSHAMCGRI